MAFAEIIQGILAVSFLIAGLWKLFSSKEHLQRKMSWVKGFKRITIKLISTVEVLAAILLSMPLFISGIGWITPSAAAILVMMMIGAVLTHITRKQYKESIPAVSLLILSSLLLYLTYQPLHSLLFANTFLTTLISYLILGAGGVMVSLYINNKKSHKQKMVCNIVAQDCNAVVNSKYGKTFGIENTLLGGLYYGAVALYGLLGFFVAFPQFISTIFLWGSGGAALFSLYLIFIQTFKLKQFCQYCLLSAGISVLIFLVALVF